MSYQRISSGGNVLEQKDGKFYINGIDVKTGNLGEAEKTKMFITSLIFGMLCFAAGFGIASIN